MSPSRRYCFTSYDSDIPFTCLPSFLSYCVFQQEKCPSTGKLHYQGFLVLNGPQRLSYLKSNINNGYHWELAKGNNEQNRDYCTKEDTRIAGPWEFGVFAKQGSNKRKIMEQFENDSEELRYSDPKKYRRCLAVVVNKRFNDVILPSFDRSWQVQLLSLVGGEPDSRTIIWVYGSEGNEGKSTFAKGLIQQGWFYSRGGKADDVLYQYIEHGGNAVFDIPRDKEEYINFSTMEAIKDRIIICNKYEPVRINYDNYVHLVVMANFLPCLSDEYDEKGKVVKKQLISRDRVVIIECKEPIYYK